MEERVGSVDMIDFCGGESAGLGSLVNTLETEREGCVRLYISTLL